MESLLEGFLTKEQLAQQLGRSTRTIDRWHVLRIGPPRVAVGNLVLYSRDGVTRWLEQAASGKTAGHTRRKVGR
jgi:hypothetical protein